MVLRETQIPGSVHIGSWPAAYRIPFGAAIVPSAKTAGADTVKAAISETGILGLADRRKEMYRGDYDGFWSVGQEVKVIGKYGIALVTPNGANVNIDNDDFLEVADLGNGSTSAHGILEEAGSAAGTVFTIASVAKALQTVAMGSDAYKVPASNVAVGDTSITMAAADLALMKLKEGDLILLEDLNGALQVNMVASVSGTTIGLVMSSTVALTVSDSDLVTKIFRCRVELIK